MKRKPWNGFLDRKAEKYRSGIMKKLAVMVIAALFFIGCAKQEKAIKKQEVPNMSIYDIKVKDMKDAEVSLSEYKGKVLLIVNTATLCGYTPQYPGLQELYVKYRDRGFELLDFPCNQFMGQAPGTVEEIHATCSTRFGITFKMFQKIDVNGKNESPLYTFLKAQTGGKDIRWNFTKFLIDRQGNVVRRFDSKDKPEDIAPEIEKIL